MAKPTGQLELKPLRAEFMRRGKCRDCGEPVIFLRNANSGNWMPMERRVIKGYTDAGIYVQCRESHFAHCPERIAKEGKKRWLARWGSR